MTSRAVIKFTPALVEKLRSEYSKAVAENMETFTFDGHELDIQYAMYLLEYLDRQMGAK